MIITDLFEMMLYRGDSQHIDMFDTEYRVSDRDSQGNPYSNGVVNVK